MKRKAEITDMARNGTTAAVEPQPIQQPPQQLPVADQQIDLDEVNGRIAELSELNSALTARCANMRGQMAKKDAEIRKLTEELTRRSLQG